MATLAPYTFKQYFDNNGEPLSGGLIYTYEAGTTTPKATYTDQSEDTANANPVVLDANGRADIWLDTGNYKLEIRDSADVLIKTVDNVAGQSTGGIVSYNIATNTAIGEGYDRGNLYVTGTTTLSLLAAADATDGFGFWVYNEGSAVVTIDPDGSETINNAATLDLREGASARVFCDGDEWYAFVQNNVFTVDGSAAGQVLTSNGPSAEPTFQTSGAINVNVESFLETTDFTGGVTTSLTLAAVAGSENNITVYFDGVTQLHSQYSLSGTTLTFTSAIPVGVDEVEVVYGTQLDVGAPSDGTVTFPKVASSAIASQAEAEAGTASDKLMTPERTAQAITEQAPAITLMASQSLSGTSNDFTGIPPGVRKVTVNLLEALPGGSGDLRIQIGDSGGIETTGYSSVSTSQGGSSNSNTTDSTGFVVRVSSSVPFTVAIELTLQDATTNTWICSYVAMQDNGFTVIGAGRKALSSELTQVRVSGSSGQSWTSGDASVTYQ